MLVVPWHPSSTLQLYRYYFNLDKLSCKLTGISWFLLSGSEPSVILKISKPLKTSGFLFTASSHFKPWRYPMCISLSASFTTNWKKNIWETGQIEYTMNLFHFLSEKKNRMPLHLLHHKLLLQFLQSQQHASNRKSIWQLVCLLLTADEPPYKFTRFFTKMLLHCLSWNCKQ